MREEKHIFIKVGEVICTIVTETNIYILSDKVTRTISLRRANTNLICCKCRVFLSRMPCFLVTLMAL